MPQIQPKSLASHGMEACFCSRGLAFSETKNHITVRLMRILTLIYHNFSCVGLTYPTNAKDVGMAGADGQHNVKYH